MAPQQKALSSFRQYTHARILLPESTIYRIDTLSLRLDLPQRPPSRRQLYQSQLLRLRPRHTRRRLPPNRVFAGCQATPTVRESLSVVQKTAKTAKVGAMLGPWLIKHCEAVSKPLIDSFIREVRKIPSTDKIGTIGFCWGGWYAIFSAHAAEPGQGVDAAYACHPSLVAIPGDFDPVVKSLSLAPGSKDSLMGEKEIGQIKELLSKVRTRIILY